MALMSSIFWHGALWLILVTYSKAAPSISNATYYAERDQQLNEDISTMLGEDIVLTADEEKVNSLLMGFKDNEFAVGFTTPLLFPPAVHFFNALPLIQNSDVFNIINQMPKGAALHLHDLAISSIDWVVSELTYWDDLYMCLHYQNIILFRFLDMPSNESCEWYLVSEERDAYSSPEEFDLFLYKQLSLYTNDPRSEFRDSYDIWSQLTDKIETITGLVTYVEAWKSYLTKALQEMVDDNISYIEVRSRLPLLYDKGNITYTLEETMDVYREVIQNFTANNKDRFLGVRIIYAPLRTFVTEEVWNDVDLVIQLRESYPELIAGFDLVGREETYAPLIYLINPLLTLGEQDPPIPVFYHAGETDWQGISADGNLYDAILLNSTRIGHGYAINKHPTLMQMVKDRDVPIEICPIANQVMMLVKDLRNHPAGSLATISFPMVVSSDAPSLWRALPLSHDFYEAFMGFGGAKADLRFLKKLALNSIRYSSVSDVDKLTLQDMWMGQWDNFIQSTISKNNL